MGHHHFFLLQQVILPGVFYNGRYIGGHIATGLILGRNQRAAPADAVNGIRFPFQQHTEAVSSLHLRRSGMDGCHRALVQLHMVVQQCRRYFGIGLGQEVISFTLQPLPQRPVVFYNAVMHQRHTALPVGVGIHIIGHTMGGPAGVPDAAVAGKALVAAGGPQVAQPPCRLDDLYFSLVPQGNTGAVIAAVFQVFQPMQQLFPGVLRPRITNDSTHK